MPKFNGPARAETIRGVVSRAYRQDDLDYWYAHRDLMSMRDRQQYALADIGARLTELHRILDAAGDTDINAREALEAVGL